ncbi:efflux RND transporter permease subunit [Aureliella helgolandensis]|uniref:Multidrug efflux system subunit MdtC n=1 Tax=Aureliella helgolandensis TaxID=2527968 RepID=A0A518G6X0_9BACT|nr:efflux RND transporter permease subunit [Aureliella helgolandensis]QDV24337.1 multidrug efflux system subunit MdtC [Aureliella helgolandensis]
MTNRTFENLSHWSLRHRRSVWLLVGVISIVAGLGFWDPDWPHRLLAQFSATQEQAATDEAEQSSGRVFSDPASNVRPLSLSSADTVLVVESDDFFNEATTSALRHVVDKLEALDQVSSVLWMDRVPMLNIFGLPEPLLPRANGSEQRFASAKAKALTHPLVVGQLLSDDAQTLLMLINLNPYFVLEDADATTVLTATARAAAEEFPGTDLSFRATGRKPTTIAAVSAHESNQLKYQIIGNGMIVLMALILFRGVRAVVIVALAPLMGVFWTMGCIRYLGYFENPLIDVILPILVSLVALTDGVHLMVQIRKLRATGLSPNAAAQRGLSQVGMACLLTSLTTAIGFGSLMLADSKWVQQFGLCSTIGVVFSFLSVITIIPLACSTWLGRGIDAGHSTNLIDRHLGRIGSVITWVLGHRTAISVGGIVTTALLVAMCMTLKPDQRQSDGLPQSAEATQAMLHVDQAFGGLEFANVDIRWDEQTPRDSSAVLEVVIAVDDLLAQDPLIGHPLSIRNLIDFQPGSGPPRERMSLLELLPPPLKRAFFIPEERFTLITFRVQDLGIAAYGPVFERIEKGLAQIQEQHPSFHLELSGGAIWRWHNLYQIVVDLATSLGTASLIILIVLAVVYRSIRIGLISIIPNLFPLAFTGAYLAMMGYNLEIVMVCNFTICLGIAVDDTIHFLTRYQEEQTRLTREHRDTQSPTKINDQAIKNAFTGVGTALIMTTSVLVAGFAVVTFSDSRDHQIFATMGALTIAAALFCDLVFLPALLSYFRPGNASKPFAVKKMH